LCSQSASTSGRERHGTTDSGIKFFRNGDEPVGIRIVVKETVELQPPALGMNIFPDLEEEKPTVVYREPDVRPLIVNRSSESAAIELITPLGSVDIAPEDHLELWRVPASEIGELQVRIWADGDASALDDLPGLFRALGNDHYRLYLVRGSRKVLLLDVLLRNGVPLPVVRPPAADAASQPQAPAEGQAPPEPADQNAEAAAESASAITVPVDMQASETDEPAGQAAGNSTAAVAFAVAALGERGQVPLGRPCRSIAQKVPGPIVQPFGKDRPSPRLKRSASIGRWSVDSSSCSKRACASFSRSVIDAWMGSGSDDANGESGRLTVRRLTGRGLPTLGSRFERIETRIGVWPAKTISPSRSSASMTRLPFSQVPLVLFRSRI
jgi:hypothetical protein